jgi:hypothetical protein
MLPHLFFFLALPYFSLSAKTSVLRNASKSSLQAFQKQPILVKRMEHDPGMFHMTTDELSSVRDCRYTFLHFIHQHFYLFHWEKMQAQSGIIAYLF